MSDPRRIRPGGAVEARADDVEDRDDASIVRAVLRPWCAWLAVQLLVLIAIPVGVVVVGPPWLAVVVALVVLPLAAATAWFLFGFAATLVDLRRPERGLQVEALPSLAEMFDRRGRPEAAAAVRRLRDRGLHDDQR